MYHTIWMHRDFRTFSNATNIAEKIIWRMGAKTRALKRCIATCVRVGWNRMFCVCGTESIFFLASFIIFIFIYMYSIVEELCFKNAKWLLLPWPVAAGIVRGVPQSLDSCLIVEVSATCVETWGRVRWRMAEVWLWNLKAWFAYKT